jgi:hypothetical protein
MDGIGVRRHQDKRRCTLEEETLIEIRKKIEKHIRDSYLKKIQALQG